MDFAEDYFNLRSHYAYMLMLFSKYIIEYMRKIAIKAMKYFIYYLVQRLI